MRLIRPALSLTLLLSTSQALAQEPAPEPADPSSEPAPLPPPTPPPPARTAPQPYYYVPPPEGSSEGPSLGALRPKSVTAMRPGAVMLLFNWAIAAPIGSLGDYVDGASFRGVQLDLRYWVHRGVSLGFSGGWQLFDEKKDRATYPIDSGAITATFYRSMELVPLLATVHVYPGAYGPVKPYAGLGIGPSYTYFETLAADLAWVKKEWYFTVQPEAGMLIGRDGKYRGFGLNLSVRYTWLPATFGDVTNVQSLSGQIGLYSLF